MIIVPRILTGLLREVDTLHAKTLALVFAEHALRSCRDLLAPVHLDLALAYIAAAEAWVEGAYDIEVLAHAHRGFFAGRDGEKSSSERVMWLASIAVSVCCQRDMEQAGIIVRQSYVPDVIGVAREAQMIVGSCVSRNSSGTDSQVTAMKKRARWDEAKWQLIKLIETAPVPS